METFRILPQDIVEFISYCPESGELRWIQTSKYAERFTGKLWGYVNPATGYIVGRFKCRNWLAHRVAWLLGTGEDPGNKTVDHRNGNRTDNRLENLRLLTKRQQRFNCGTLGYRYVPERNKFRSQIKVDGKSKFLGSHDCPLMARIAYHDEAIKRFEDTPFVPRGIIKGNPTITNKGND